MLRGIQRNQDKASFLKGLLSVWKKIIENLNFEYQPTATMAKASQDRKGFKDRLVLEMSRWNELLERKEH